MTEEPIRVRVYGLVRLTRGGYLVLQSVLYAGLVGLLTWWLAAGMHHRFAGNMLLRNLQWLFVAGLMFITFDMYFVLGSFHRKHRIAERVRRS